MENRETEKGTLEFKINGKKYEWHQECIFRRN